MKPLSRNMQALLVRMLDWLEWARWLAHLKDGNAKQGVYVTSNALRDRGLVRYLRTSEDAAEIDGIEVHGPGWILTDAGKAEALRLKMAGLSPEAVDRAKRKKKADKRRRWGRR